MRRKVSKVGPATLVVSLPSKWVKKYGVKKGDEVEVEELEGKLVIDRNFNSTQKKEISLEDINETYLRTIISSFYRKGYSELILKFNEQRPPFGIIQEIINSLIGYELISQENNSVLIKDIMKQEEMDINAIVNKLFQNITLLIDILFEQIENKRYDINELANIRKNILKMRDYCQRNIIIQNSENSYELYSLVMYMERIAGEFYFIGEYLYSSKVNLNQKNIDFLRKHYEYFRELHNCFIKKNFSISNKFLKTIWDITDKDKLNCDYLKLTKIYNGQTVFFCSKILKFLSASASRLVNI